MIGAQGVITQDEEAYADNDPGTTWASTWWTCCVPSSAARPRAPRRQVDFDAARLPNHKSTMAVYGFANGAMAQVWITYELPAPGLGSMMQYLITGSRA
jgi:hypothetical protein